MGDSKDGLPNNSDGVCFHGHKSEAIIRFGLVDSLYIHPRFPREVLPTLDEIPNLFEQVKLFPVPGLDLQQIPSALKMSWLATFIVTMSVQGLSEAFWRRVSKVVASCCVMIWGEISIPMKMPNNLVASPFDSHYQSSGQSRSSSLGGIGPSPRRTALTPTSLINRLEASPNVLKMVNRLST